MGQDSVNRNKRNVSIELPEDSNSCSSCPPVNKPPQQFAQKTMIAAVQDPRAVANEPCSWFEIHHLVRAIASQIKDSKKKYDCILSISTGGLIPAKLIAEELGIDNIVIVPFRNKKLIASEMPVIRKAMRYLAVDDIYDTGNTYRQLRDKLRGHNCDFAFCMSRFPEHPGFSGRILNHYRWIVFPWEKEIK